MKIDNDIQKMIVDNARLRAFIETFKEFLRWVLSFAIGYVIENGYSFFAKSKLDPDTLLIIGACFRAADYFWHKYKKETEPDSTGKSLGLYRF